MNSCVRRSLHRLRYVACCIFYIALTALMPSGIRAQAVAPDNSITGRLWIVAFPDTTTNVFDPRFPPTMNDRMQLFLYSAVDGNEVSIHTATETTTLALSAGIFKTYTTTAPIVTESGIPSKNTIRLESKQPILVYCYIVTKFGGEAWTPLPVAAWGKDYYAATLPGNTVKDIAPNGPFNFTGTPKAAPAEIMVIAAFDSTVVTIDADSSLFAGKPKLRKILLMANEAYLVQSAVDTTYPAIDSVQPDLAGAHITATRPIAVVSGTTRTPGKASIDQGLAKNSVKNLVMEWLVPTDQHGTEFAYTPTWDDNRKTGNPTEQIDEKRPGEFVRIYGISPTETKIRMISTDTTDATVRPGEVAEFFLDTPRPVGIRTDLPAQIMMSSVSAVQSEGIVYWGNYLNALYKAKAATYMTQLTPREQWVGFAPFYVPADPQNMNHYIDVVTDSTSMNRIVFKLGTGAEQTFIFNRGPIPGSNLVWGSMQLVPGTTYYLRGLSPDVRFTGFVYGNLAGYELFRPGKIRKWGDVKTSGSDSALPNSLMHNGEYEENVAISYGYPLVSRHYVLGKGDSLLIDTVRSCHDLEVHIEVVDTDPVGLASIDLAPGAQNTQIFYISPNDPFAVLTSTSARVTVAPIDPTMAASATLVITDRTGRTWTIPYASAAAGVTFDTPGSFDLGEANLRSCDEHLIVATNTSQQSIHLDSLSFARGTEGFSVTNTDPPLPTDLASAQTLKIWICNTPPRGEAKYDDSLIVRLGCLRQTLPLQAEGVKPCLLAPDLPFDTIHIGSGPVTRTLQLCNDGRGYLTFDDASGLPPVDWTGSEFSISQSDIDKLKNIRLTQQQCTTIEVTFTPTSPGVFGTTAHFRTNTFDCRDSSIWNALVVAGPLAAPEQGASLGYRLKENRPNPFGGATGIEFTLGRGGHTTVTIVDASGRTVATIVDAEMEAGEHRIVWDASGAPSGTYYCRLVSGGWNGTLTMLVRH